jgi:hypothetical protein
MMAAIFRRTLLVAAVAAPLRFVEAEPARALGLGTHVFIDWRYIESATGVTIKFNPPALPRENLIPKDRPWEQQRLGVYSSVLQDADGYKFYYEAHDEPSYRNRFICLAVSRDGVTWTKPNLGVVEYRGSKENNIVATSMLGSVFVDPFDAAGRRYKMISRGGTQDARWAPSVGMDRDHMYLLYAPDGVHWEKDPAPVLPFYVGAPTSVVWDEIIERWVIYPRGYSTRGGGRLFTRVTRERDKLSSPYPFRPVVGRQPTANGGYRQLYDEIPVVLETDERDPVGSQIYTMCASRYGADAYVAFPTVWYSRQKWFGERIDPEASDWCDVQFAVSRDGVNWQRPWREPVIPVGFPGSGAEGQVYVAGMVNHGDQIYVYYSTIPTPHLTGDLVTPVVNVVARAIWRKDGLTSVDAPYEGGEFTTPLVTLSGAALELNAQTGGGGFIRVEVLGQDGHPIRGFTLAESEQIRGNSLHHVPAWKSEAKFADLAGRPVRLRFKMRDAKLYSMQFLEKEKPPK